MAPKVFVEPRNLIIFSVAFSILLIRVKFFIDFVRFFEKNDLVQDNLIAAWGNMAWKIIGYCEQLRAGVHKAKETHKKLVEKNQRLNKPSKPHDVYDEPNDSRKYINIYYADIDEVLKSNEKIANLGI